MRVIYLGCGSVESDFPLFDSLFKDGIDAPMCFIIDKRTIDGRFEEVKYLRGHGRVDIYLYVHKNFYVLFNVERSGLEVKNKMSNYMKKYKNELLLISFKYDEKSLYEFLSNVDKNDSLDAFKLKFALFESESG